MATEERVLGPMGDKVIFENDRVRIWELVIPPGGDSNCHVHDLDYVLVQLDGDRVAAVPEPDTKSPYNEYMEADVVPGQVIYIERGGIEIARNVGEVPYSEIIIELKD
jgi:beta-alanine degradation protein BauB